MDFQRGCCQIGAVPKTGVPAESCPSSHREKLHPKGTTTVKPPANELRLGGRAKQAPCIHLLHAPGSGLSLNLVKEAQAAVVNLPLTLEKPLKLCLPLGVLSGSAPAAFGSS